MNVIMKNTIKFLTRLKSWNIEINNLRETFKLKEAIKRKEENIYFLSGVSENVTGRASDKDIVLKKYFVIDLDIANAYQEKYLEEIDDSIKEIGYNIAEELKGCVFGDWCYLVFSWRWLHLYYLIEERNYKPEIYSIAVKEIYKMWNKYWWDSVFYADNACSNIARIMRLPWSYNQKNWEQCEILLEQDKVFSLDLDIIWEKEYQIQKEEEQQRRKEIEKKLLSYNNWDNELYNKIISIPAYSIAMILVPEYPFDWKRNFKNKKWGFTWYYYNESFNTIHNWGSKHFNYWDSSSWFNTFSLVKNFNWWDSATTFTYFKKLLWMK